MAECKEQNIDDMWQQLEKSTQTLSHMLKGIRELDAKKSLFVGKYHSKEVMESGVLNMIFSTSKDKQSRDQLCDYSILDAIPSQHKQLWIHTSTAHSSTIDRVVGCMVGMAIGDSVGHPFEFLPITATQNPLNTRPRFTYQNNKQKYWNEFNKFNLKRGQWTDDNAMGLCMADSLILHDRYNGSDIRMRFWNWWQNGYNNGLRHDKQRDTLSSVGLGGNISMSIYTCPYAIAPPVRYKVDHDREDSGNGSIMRLAPIPLYYHSNINKATAFATESSFTTHPGYIAAEACSFLAYIIVKAVNGGIHTKKANQNADFIPCTRVKMFMDFVAACYGQKLKEDNVIIRNEMNEIKQVEMNKMSEENKNEDEASVKKRMRAVLKGNRKWKLLKRKRNAKRLMIRLIESAEGKDSKECCWNWRSEYGALPTIGCYYLRRGGRDARRANKYNGYPVSAEYWGSYCMDGMAMAMHCVYHSECFADAIEKCVNLLGDADSTGSIGGQIAGAIYGYQSIVKDEQQRFLIENLNKWDNYDVGFRGVLLYILGNEMNLPKQVQHSNDNT
eukprot:549928_1